MPTVIQPTPLELDLRAVTDGQTAAKIARALKRTHGITTRDGLEVFYHTRPDAIKQTHNIGAQRFHVIEGLLHTPKSIELPDDRLEALK
jgi:hypothetical protein